MAWWIGDSTCSGTNTAPTSASGPTRSLTPLHRAHERADGDGEQRGQHSAQHEHDPPRDRKGAIGLRQDPEEPPLVAAAKAFDHGCHSPSAPIALPYLCGCSRDMLPCGWGLSSLLDSALEQARTKRAVLEKYTKTKRLKELQSEVERARADELAKKSAYERALVP